MARKTVRRQTAWREVRRRIDAAADRVPRLRVGVVGTEAKQVHAESGLTNAEIAVIHEFGAPRANIPERSFIRSTLRDPDVRRRLRALQANLARAVIAGMDQKKALGTMGEFLASQIRATITRGVDPPLKPATIARKGSSKPLIDTGQLRRAISWVIVP